MPKLLSKVQVLQVYYLISFSYCQCRWLLSFKLPHNVYIYELWRASAHNFPDKNWLWEIRRIFQVRTDQAIAYILLCCELAFFTA